MKFTICIPTYNQQQFIRETLDSALAQTVPCEIIVVNDGSTDQTSMVLEEYGDKIKVVNQVNKGLASARNTGIMHAAGEWFLPLDSDDILETNCLEEIEKAIDNAPEFDIFSPSFVTFGAQQQMVMLDMRPNLESFKVGNRVGYCSAVRLSVLKEIGGYSPRMVWGYEDLHLWYNLLSRGHKIATIPEPLWRYRVREGSMMATAQQHHTELMAQIHKDFHI